MYDIIVVGGGLAGASIAKVMAENGLRVLVLERERQFKDRVRGEGIFQWGVADLKELGLYQLLVDGCAREVPWFDTYLGGERIGHRNLVTSTPQETAGLNWIHHEMEEVLLAAAERAGADVRRGARASTVKPGELPSVCIEYEQRSEELSARLVVCADGRGSLGRRWGDFRVRQDTYGMLIAGLLCERMPKVPEDTNCWLMNPECGRYAFLCPQGQGRVRTYVFHPKNENYRFQGFGDLPRFVEDALGAGVPTEWIAQSKPIGPLSTFDGADSWVDHPYKNGVALIGDAAASNDPSYGQGQCLAIRDVRVLRDFLLANDDWDRAGHLFASAHDRYYGALHKFEGWVYQLFYETGPEADVRRARAFPLLGEEPTRMPDAFFTGPEVPLGETVRRRFFGED